MFIPSYKKIIQYRLTIYNKVKIKSVSKMELL